MDYNGKFFKYSVGFFMVLLNIYLFYQVSFLLTPVANFIAILFIPIIASGLFYYLLRPIVRYFEKLRIPRPLSILILYIATFYLMALASVHIVPAVIDEINEFSASLPEKIDLIKYRTGDFFKDYNLMWSIDEIKSKLSEVIQHASKLISHNFLSFLSTLTRITTILVSIPVILFFLLKDEEKIHTKLRGQIKGRYSQDVWKILKDIDKTLEKYIIGQATVALVLGVLFFIAYSIIGLNYALLLALIATIMNFIPYLGAVIASIPALLVGFAISPLMALKVGIIILIVQQTEANLVSPYVIGKSLQISPLTVTLLLLGAGSLYGLLGLLLITPVYAISKVFFINLLKIYKLRTEKKNQQYL